MDPIKEVKAAFPTVKFVLSLLFGFIIINLILELVGAYVPVVPSIIQRPIATIKSLFTKSPSA